MLQRAINVSHFNNSAAPAGVARRPVLRPRPLAMRPTQDSRVESEWARMLESCRGELTRFATWLARDRAIAEDIVQEALLRAWRARTDLRDRAAVRSWLFTIVRREHARLYERKQLPLVCIDACVARQDPELVLYDEDPQIDELRRALLRLSDDYRVPLIMQVMGGFTTAEIASELGITVNAVLTRLFRARNQLREIYGTAALGRDAASQGA